MFTKNLLHILQKIGYFAFFFYFCSYETNIIHINSCNRGSSCSSLLLIKAGADRTRKRAYDYVWHRCRRLQHRP